MCTKPQWSPQFHILVCFVQITRLQYETYLVYLHLRNDKLTIITDICEVSNFTTSMKAQNIDAPICDEYAAKQQLGLKLRLRNSPFTFCI